MSSVGVKTYQTLVPPEQLPGSSAAVVAPCVSRLSVKSRSEITTALARSSFVRGSGGGKTSKSRHWHPLAR